MTQKATTTDEFFDLVKSKYQDGPYHHLPLIFANLLLPNKKCIVVAKSKTRNELFHEAMSLRQYVEPHILFESNYGFIRSNHTFRADKSTLRFLTTGIHGGVQKIRHAQQVDDILLYGFDFSKKEWNHIHAAALDRINRGSGRLMIHNA